MKITFILPPVNMSGGIKVVAIYAEALAKKGHEVLLVSPSHRRIPLLRKIRSFVSGKGWPFDSKHRVSHIDGRGLNHVVVPGYASITNLVIPDADVVIATWWKTAEWVLGLSDSKGSKVYFIQHHEIHPNLPIERCKATYRMPYHKIVIAKWLERIMSEDYSDNDVDLVPNSVDHNQFFSPIRHKQIRPTVGFLYSHSSYKGVDVTLRAICKLRNRFSNLRVISFGSVTPVNRKEFGNEIEFYPSPEQDKIRDLYTQCDVWITASKTEGFNLPAMEAMACRTPVASTKAGWPEEVIVNGVNGVLVDVDDVDSLTECVAEILSLTDGEWAVMSENAYMTTKDSSWKSSVELFENSLKNSCAHSCRG